MPPRLSPPSRTEVADDVGVLLDLATPPGGECPPTVSVLAHQPALLGPFLGWAAALALQGPLAKRAADELHGTHTISDATSGVLTDHLGPAALAEIPFVVGQYTMLSLVVNTLGAER